MSKLTRRAVLAGIAGTGAAVTGRLVIDSRSDDDSTSMPQITCPGADEGYGLGLYGDGAYGR